MLTRRTFHSFCTSLAAVMLSEKCSVAATTNASPKTVKFKNGTVVPAIGQGSWHLGQGRHPGTVEQDALQTGISLGMTLIDTALVYGDGQAEELIGRVIADQRDRVFLVSKIPPARAKDEEDIVGACGESLARLNTDHLDLYLLHWRDDLRDLPRIVGTFEKLKSADKIKAWGVSNFNVQDLEELFRIPHGDNCATNQVGYSLGDRSIERDVLPWCQQRGMPVMAYSPLGGPGAGLLRNPKLARIATGLDCTAAALALAWTIRSGNIIAVVESGLPAHVRDNAVALSLNLTPEDLEKLDQEFRH